MKRTKGLTRRSFLAGATAGVSGSLSHDGRKTLAFRRTLQFNHVRRMLSGIGLHMVWSEERSSSFQSPRLQAGVVYLPFPILSPRRRWAGMGPLPRANASPWVPLEWVAKVPPI